MKKLLILFLILIPFFVSSKTKESVTLTPKLNYYQQDKFFEEVQSSKQLIFNITASFQKFKKNNSKKVFIPIIVIKGISYLKNDFEDFNYNQIKSIKIITGKDVKALFGSSAPELAIFIDLKNK